MTDIPGTTTDIINHKMQLESGDTLTFFDSPGLRDFTEELPYIEWIIEHADLLLFVIDDSVGLSAKEQHILDLIRREKKQHHTLLIINKLDLKRKESETELALSEYHHLGFQTLIGISAKTERNLTEIHEHIQKYYQERRKTHPMTEEHKDEEEKPIAIAILGKPNAGKSTLLNTLTQKPLAKVADYAGTTRDYLVGEFSYKGKKYIAYDTAGIKKKSQQHGIEKIAYDKTTAMLEYLRPIVIFMVDCTQGITHRDMTLLQEVHHLALPMIFVLNKVDLVNPKGINAMIQNTQKYLQFAKYLPIIPMVAKEAKGIEETMKMVNLLQKENQKRIQTRELNQTLQHEFLQRPPRFPKSKIAKILYATQIAVDAPTFIVFVNHKSRVNFAFKKRVENTIRRYFGFIGVPLVIKYRNRGEQGDYPVYEGGAKIQSEAENRNEELFEELEDIGAQTEKEEREKRKKKLNTSRETNNKGKRKREKKREETSISTSKTPTKTTRTAPKRDSKYFNTKAGNQKKIDKLFEKVYGNKQKK